MPKQTTKKRTYLKQWEDIPEFSNWIRKSYNSEAAHCKYCNRDIRAHKSDLDAHVKTEKHQKIEKIKAKQKPIPLAVPQEVKISAEQKKKCTELRLALFTALKSSFK